MEILLIFMLVIIVILGSTLFFMNKNLKSLIAEHDKVINVFEETQMKEAQEVQTNIEMIEKHHMQEIAEKQKDFDTYKQSVLTNFNESVPYGERFIIRTILELLGDEKFSDYTFYHQVEYQDDKQLYKLDFLVVSPYGVIVLESKYWKGVTYLYDDSYGDIFQDTLFKNFGIGSSKKIRVFNAKFSEDTEKEIVLSCYNNPVSQVREYSFDIRNHLGLYSVKNAVVFHKTENSDIVFNDQKLNSESVDGYTKIITSEVLKEYFIEESNGKNKILSEEIINSIENRLIYKTKFDKSNYQDKIFFYLLGK